MPTLAEKSQPGPPSETEMKSVEKGHEHVMCNADQLDVAILIVVDLDLDQTRRLRRAPRRVKVH